MSKDIRTDAEFENLIPPLTTEEYNGLEASLIDEGCRDALVMWKDIILDGHNRLKICCEHGIVFSIVQVKHIASRQEAKVWIIRNQFARRNLTIYQRIELSIELEKCLPSYSGKRTDLTSEKHFSEVDKPSRKAAAIAGISQPTYSKGKYIAEHAEEETKAKLRTPKSGKSIDGVYKALKKTEQKQDKAARKAAIPKDLPPVTERYAVYRHEIKDRPGMIKDESIDWIITDPPYARKQLDRHVIHELGSFAIDTLKPGGSLLCMIGQSYLPQVFRDLCRIRSLKYQWTLAYLMPGGQAAQLWDREVNTFWKPILWFAKGKYDGDWIGDVCRSDVNDNDKRFHDWGQSESGMADLIERFTFPGQTICDPFCGGGTTGVVAVRMNRMFIGIDYDQAAVATTLGRLAEVANA